MKIQLGNRYRDSITGWEGIAVGEYHYLHGCIRVGLEGTKDGEPKEFVFDEQRLVAVDGTPVEPKATTGGPRGYDAP